METGTRECKLHYCTLAAVLPVGLFHTDVAGHYLSVNERWCEIAGIEAAEALGDGWVQVLSPSDRERVFAEWYRSLRENLPFRLEYRFQRPDGKVIWVLSQAVAEKDEFGSVTGYIGTITDLTDCKQTQGESNQYRDHLEPVVQDWATELRNVNAQLQQEIAQRQRLEEALRNSEQLYIAQLQQAEERLRSTQEFVTKLLDHIPAPIYINTTPDQRFRLVNRTWEEFVGLRREEVIDRSLDDVLPPVLAQQCQEENQRIIDAGTPVITEECVEATNGQHYFHTIKFPIHDASGQIEAVAGISFEITERKQAEEALRLSEARFRQMAENIREVFWMADLELDQIFYVSPAYEQLWGRTCESVYAQPRSFIEAIHPDDRDRVLSVIGQHRQSGFSQEYRIVKPDGSIRWIWERAFPVQNQAGQLDSLVGVSQDISDRKQAEEALRESRERLQLFIDHAPAAVAMFDRQMRYVAVSRRWLTDFNLENQAIIGKSHYEVFPEIPEHWKDVHQRCLKGAVERCDSDRFERTNGDTAWICWEIRPWLDREGTIGGIVIFTENITDRKQAEESLRESEARFRLLAENSTDMISRHTPEEGIYLYASPACQTLLGYAPEELVGHSAYEFFHPDDIAQIRKAHTSILDLPVTYTVAYRHRCQDGHYIWLETTCRTIREQQTGAILEIQSASRDITERKQMEESLRQQCLREQLVGAIAQRIHQSLNLEEILTTTTAEIRQFLGCDRVIIYHLHTDGSGTVVVESVASEWRSIAGTKIHDCYFAENYFQLYQEGRVQALENVYTADLTSCHLDLLARFQVKANLVVPIVHEMQLWGLLVAQQCSETRQWQSVEIDLLRSLATQAAIAIHQSELYQQAQAELTQRHQAEAALRQQILKERLMVAIAQRIRQSLNLEEILNITVAEVRQFLQTDRVLIYRLWPNGIGSAVTEAVVPGQPAVLGRTFPEEVFPQESQQLYCDGRILALSDLEQAEVLPCLAEFVQHFGVKAKLVVPIVQEKTLWGLLIAHHCREPRQWQPLEIDLLKSLSTQLAIAIQQCQLYKQTQHQVHRAQALNRVIQTIRNSLDLTTIFATAVSEIAQLLATDRADIMQYLPEQKLWRFVATYPHIPNVSNPLSENIVDEDNEIAARLKRLEIVRINDISTCGDEDTNGDITCSFPRAWLLVPLHFSGSVWGSLSLVRKAQPSSWTNSEVDLACEVANQLAIALQQAELYEQSRTATAKALTQAQELEQALSELQKAQAQLVQSEKMSSLGQLVAGVAHEINNPVTFVSANVIYVEEYIQDLLALIRLYQQQYPNPTLDIQSAIEKIDLNFLVNDLPRLLCSMKVGAERICDIVSALRNFSRHAEAEIKDVDIHDGLDSTLMILQHRLRASGKNPGIEVIKEYGNLPKVECYAGQLNQVFMNLLTNAIDALEELVARGNTTEDVGVSTVVEAALCDRAQQLTTHTKPMIRIRTEVLDHEQVAIRIADNGLGMTEQVKARLFDPFFTTKPVGAGTGLGLSISYEIVVKKHGGQLSCFSELGQGTEFVIQIPLEPRSLGVPN